MRFTRVTASNWMGQSFDCELAPITLFLGPNSCGKSARLNALTLAALGYLPQEPKPIKSSRDIYDCFASFSPMSVACETDSGIRSEHRYHTIPGRDGYAVEHDFSITGKSGASIVPEMAMDVSAFSGLTGPARLKFMFKQSRSTGGAKEIADDIWRKINAEIGIDDRVILAAQACLEVGQTVEAVEWLDLVVARLESKR